MISTVFMICTLAMGVMPLTEPQAGQLATARDHTLLLDEAALYPLIENARTWELAEGETPTGAMAGARVPGYAAILADPGQYRGELFLIEGVFGRARELEGLSRGAQVGRVMEYAIGVGRDGDPAAIVLVVDGPETAPKIGATVRVSGRFFKVWDDLDMENVRTSYAVFVANGSAGLAVTGSSGASGVSGAAGGGSNTNGPILLVVLFGAAGLYYMLRRQVSRLRNGPKALPPRRLADREPEGEDETEDDALEQARIDLPQDPAEALSVLKSRHDAPD